jgi:hypothetical protein
MKKNALILSIVSLFITMGSSLYAADTALNARWTVVGAGPTGIMAVGLILDSGVPADKVVWIDPEFNVGRMGKHYRNIPGNGRVEQYISFINQCSLFRTIQSEALDTLYSLPLEQAPELEVLINPLSDISQFLKDTVVTVQDEIVGLNFHNNQWHVQTHTADILSENIVLATGAHPKQMSFEGIEQIPLDLALDKATLESYLSPDDVVAVIGSGHSAILILKYLSELSVQSVIQFYNKPIVYSVPMRNGIAWKEAGLKGTVAEWAKTVLEVNPPKNLLRIYSSDEALSTLLPTCTKVIYAGGFERNELPAINGDESIYENYDRSTGLIAPRAYGVGIAFPKQQTDPLGNVENLVGLPYVKFDELQAALKSAK